MAIHRTIPAWRAEIEQIKRRQHQNFAKIQIRIITRLFKKIVIGTPIMTGRASGSWKISLDSSVHADLGKGIWFGAKETAIAQGERDLQPLLANPYRRVYINNDVPYINKLERGFSMQAPAGMVRIAIEELRNWVHSRG